MNPRLETIEYLTSSFEIQIKVQFWQMHRGGIYQFLVIDISDSVSESTGRKTGKYYLCALLNQDCKFLFFKVIFKNVKDKHFVPQSFGPFLITAVVKVIL